MSMAFRSRFFALTLLAAGTVLPGTAFAQQHTGAPQPRVVHYANAAAHYSISYPAAWTRHKDKDLDLFVGAPDKSAFLTTNAIPLDGARPTSKEIKAQQRTVLNSMHVVASTLTSNTHVVNGVTFYTLEGVCVSKANGHESDLDVLLADGMYDGYLLDINSGVLLKTKQTDTETQLILDSLNSLTVKP